MTNPMPSQSQSPCKPKPPFESSSTACGERSEASGGRDAVTLHAMRLYLEFQLPNLLTITPYHNFGSDGSHVENAIKWKGTRGRGAAYILETEWEHIARLVENKLNRRQQVQYIIELTVLATKIASQRGEKFAAISYAIDWELMRLPWDLRTPLLMSILKS